MQGFTLFDMTHWYPYSFMKAHGSSLANSWEPMDNPWAACAPRQLWVPMNTVRGVLNIPLTHWSTHRSTHGLSVPRATTGNGSGVMRRTVSNFYVAMHHDPPARESAA